MLIKIYDKWEYSRSWRRHWVEDEKIYLKKDYPYKLLEIHCCTPYNEIIQYKYGYDLFYKSKKVKHAKTVKELKKFAESLYNGGA